MRVEAVDHGEPHAHQQAGRGEEGRVGAGGQAPDEQVNHDVATHEQHDVDGELDRELLVATHHDQRVRAESEERGQDGERELHARTPPVPRGRVAFDHPEGFFPAPV